MQSQRGGLYFHFLINGKEDGQGWRFEDATLLALKMKEGALHQRMQADSRSQERHGEDGSPLELPEGLQSCQHRDLRTSAFKTLI